MEGGERAAPLLGSTERAERSLNQIRETRRLAENTAAVGTDVLADLHHQREQLQDAVVRQGDMEDDLMISTRLIRAMFRRAAMIKLALCSVVLVLLAAIAVLLYFKLASTTTRTRRKQMGTPAPGDKKFGPKDDKSARLPPPPPPAAAAAAVAAAVTSTATSAATSAASAVAAAIVSRTPTAARPLVRTSTQPLSPSFPSPFSPPHAASGHALRALQSGENADIGAGVIILVAVGGALLLGCFAASGAKPAKRIAIICCLSLLYLLLLVMLVAIPKDELTEAEKAKEELRVVDRSSTLRALFALLIGLGAAAGLVGVLILHLAVVRRNRTYGHDEEAATDKEMKRVLQ